VKVSVFQAARHVRAHSTNADETNVHENEITNIECRGPKECRSPNDKNVAFDR
jgi:hypothetical protein